MKRRFPAINTKTVRTKRTKYKAIKTEIDGITFHSKLESEYYSYLKLRKAIGEISYFLLQVPIHIGGGVKYIADFLVVYPSGEMEYVDVKGVLTKMYKTKKKIVESLYPFKIKEVYKGDF